MATFTNTLPGAPQRRSVSGDVEPRGPSCSATNATTQQPAVRQNPCTAGVSSVASQLSDMDAMIRAMKIKAYERSSAARSRAVSTSGKNKVQVKEKDKIVVPLSKPAPSVAVSSPLQDRITGHVAALEMATASIKQAFGQNKSEQPCFKAVCRGFAVGRAKTSSSSPVMMFPDRLEYKFHHPLQGEVQMLMWFKDLVDARFDKGTLTFSFHINQPLAVFGIEYDFANKFDRLSFQFFSEEEATEFSKLMRN